MVIYVDIDGTICDTPWYNGKWDYHNSEPKKQEIKKINKLYDEGHEIVYWTARGSGSGLDWASFTEYQLNTWSCKYTRIERLKKPSFDLFIDDKCIRIEEID